ncbi:MAG: COG1361 S-layer family protein [Anaerolineaceae bacterium]
MKRSKWFQLILGGILILSLIAFVQPAHAEDPIFTVVSDSQAKSGIPGSVASYTLTFQNLTGPDPLEFTIDTVSISGWTLPASTVHATVSVPVTQSRSISIDVPIPSSATAGQNDKQVVTISTASSGGQTISLVTSVAAPAVPGKPLMMVSTYKVNSGKVSAGNTFELGVGLQNNGTGRAYNVVITFDGGTSFYPQGTGGVRNTSGIDPGNTFTATQTFLGAGELAWTDVGTIKAAVTYSDAAGVAYSDMFTLSLGVQASGSSYSYATATPVANNHAQLVVTSYKTNVDLLQPGTVFDLSLNVHNLGASDAIGATMVLGGGASSSSSSGTPQPGGVSGSSGELTNFAPLDSSNLVYLGDLKKDASATISQKLIVNTTTTPGVYTLKISFVYTNNKGVQIVDDQVITLLVYSLPQVQVDFYRDPGVITAQMENILPLQVTNLGKKSTVLGNMKVTADGAEITNNVSLVGALEPGGYYTLDAGITPNQEGPMDVLVVINYTDDFNQSRTIEQKIHIDVQAPMELTPADSTSGGGGIDAGSNSALQPETFWQKVGRFFKGLFGLDSGTGTVPSPTETTPIKINPLPGGKG